MRCATWEQVESFYRRKLRRNGRLSMKVPFECEIGTPVTLGLELPNQISISIDGTVTSAGGLIGGRTSIDVTLYGLSEDLLARLEAMVADARLLGSTAEEVGIDDERRMLAAREGELRRLRRLAVHEVLGVPREPSAIELRAAWSALAGREHPDAVARFASPALTAVAEEAMILAARAFDRLKATLVADRRAVAVGATLRPPSSWAAVDASDGVGGFFAEALTPPVEDAVELVDHSGSHRIVTPDQLAAAMQATELPLPPPPVAAAPLASVEELLPPVLTPVPPPTSVGVRWGASDLFSDLDLGPANSGHAPIAVESSLAQARSGPGDRFVRQVREKLGAGDHDGAQEVAQAALHLYAGDRRLRGLYHVAAAMAACARADRFGAVAALETALAHDPSCHEAATALDQLRRATVPSAPAIQRLFS